jgi:hypothetical protein
VAAQPKSTGTDIKMLHAPGAQGASVWCRWDAWGQLTCVWCILCRYQKLLAECSPVRLLDLKDMQKQVCK